MSTKPNDTETEQNANIQYCTRCGAEAASASEAHQHVKDEHDNQPTQMLDTLDPDQVVSDAIAEVDDLIENWGELDKRGKEGKIIVIREILDGYETVRDMEGDE